MPVTLNATLLPPQFESQGEVFAQLVETGSLASRFRSRTDSSGRHLIYEGSFAAYVH